MTKIIKKTLKIFLILTMVVNGLFLDQLPIPQPVQEAEAQQDRFKGLAMEIPTVSRYFQGQQGTTVVMVKKDGEPVSGAQVKADYYKPDNSPFLSDQTFTEIVAGTGIYYNNFNIPSNADLGVYKVKIKSVSTTTSGTFSDNFNDGDAVGWTSTGGTWTVESGIYKQKAKDPAWYRSTNGTSTWENYTYTADVRLDAATSSEWMASSTVSSGLGDVGEHAAPEVFQMGATWYLIAGESDGTFNGYNWTGSGWQSTSTIVSGLVTDTDLQTKPAVFQMGSIWYLIYGDYWSGNFTGYTWKDSTWQSTSTITNGLSSIGYGSAPEVFQKDGTWYLISGAKDGKFYGYNWTGSTWQTDNTIVSGLGDIGISSGPEVFQMDSTWYLIAGEYDGDFAGFYWTGSQWAASASIITGLTATWYTWGHTKPTVYQIGSIWDLIAGTYNGTSTGYSWGEKSGTWGKYAGLTFRYSDPASNYEFHLIEDGTNDRVGLRKNGSLIAMSDPGSVSISANTWYTLKIEANEDSVKGYVDDVLKIDYYDPVPVAKGKVGFTNYDTMASYDNVSVTIGAATSTAYLSHDFKVEAQTDYVSSLQKEWNVYLSDFGEISTGRTYTAKLFILNYQSTHTDPFAVPKIKIWNSSSTLLVNNAEMSFVSTGIYKFNYEIATSSATTTFGVWETEASVEVEAGKTIKVNDYWEVEGSPAQVIINAITDTSVPSITADVTISNEGNAGYEYKYEWCVVDTEWNACGGGDDIFYSSASKFIEAFTDWNTNLNATVPDPGNYWFKVVVYWGTEQSGASQTFTTVVAFIPKSQNWRWYLDENNETPTYSLAGENQAPTYLLSGETIKLRTTIKETSGNTGEDIKMRLQYSTTSDFSAGVYFLPEVGSCGASAWCYGDGVDTDNATITTMILSDSDTKATHNESGTSATTYDLLANAAAEWEFTVKNNEAATGTAYYFRAYDNTNSSAIPKNTGKSYPSIVPGTASLSFGVVGLPIGTTTEGVTTNVSTTAASVSFGELSFSTSAIGAQRLSISTNAPQGYQVLTFGRQELISDTGNTIYPISGTNETPVGWSVATSSYGYHTGDDTLSNVGNGSSRFAADNTYAKFETATKEVAYNPLPITDESIDLIFRTEVTVLQVPGTYNSEVVYITVPTF